jgi:hypothetical protein
MYGGMLYSVIREVLVIVIILSFLHVLNLVGVFRQVGCGCVDWIGLAQDTDRWRALVGAVMNLRVP